MVDEGMICNKIELLKPNWDIAQTKFLILILISE